MKNENDNENKVGVDDFIKMKGFDELQERIEKPFWTFKNFEDEDILTFMHGEINLPRLLSKHVLIEDNIAKKSIIDQINKKTKIGIGHLKEVFNKCVDQWKGNFHFKNKNKSDSSIKSIITSGRQPNEILKDLEDLIHEINDMEPIIYRRENFLVTIESNTNLGCKQIETLLPIRFKEKIIRNCHFYKINNDGKSIPSGDFDKDLIAILYHSYALTLNGLNLIIRGPVYTPDFTLINEYGYHRNYKLYFDEGGMLIRDLPMAPTQDDAKLALKFLLENIFHEFCFADKASKTNALLILFSIPLRCAMNLVPLFLANANAPGAGKTTLFQLLSVLTTGMEGIMRQLDFSKSTEIERFIIGELKAGKQIVFIDNTKKGTHIDSPLVASVLTSTNVSGKILYKTEAETLPNKTIWLINGNNLTLSEELSRRTILINLNPKAERPAFRKFKNSNFIPSLIENREEIYKCVLICIQAWIHAGRPEGKKLLPSFEQWSRTMGGIAEFLGMEGFLEENQPNLLEGQDETEMRQLFHIWYNIHGEKEISSMDVWNILSQNLLMNQILSRPSKESQLSSLGIMLSKNNGTVKNGLMLMVRKKPTGNRYSLIKVDDLTTPTDNLD